MANMEGIMILNTITTPVYSFGWNGWCWALIPFILLAIYLIAYGHKNRRHVSARRWRSFGVAALVGILCLGTAICSVENVRHENIYQVLVDSSVKMEEFRANYEIVEQVGITYMIKVK
jgi:hypothetical protein